MTLVSEWFGFDPADLSEPALNAAANQGCPFISRKCTKSFSDRTVSGVCAMQHPAGEPVATCPNRLYANDYQVLRDVVGKAFGAGHQIIHPSEFALRPHDGKKIVAFGQRFGHEVRIPTRGRGSYSVDWVLARISAQGELAEFVAVEVQTIDTTGTYKPEVEFLRRGARTVTRSRANFNWENVSKRILPQLIYKGHLLRTEPLCSKGLFFVCPTEVFARVNARLGGTMREYSNLQPGSLTFHHYSLGPVQSGFPRSLILGGEFSTTVDQVALAFTAPDNLPAAGTYESAIRAALAKL